LGLIRNFSTILLRKPLPVRAIPSPAKRLLAIAAATASSTLSIKARSAELRGCCGVQSGLHTMQTAYNKAGSIHSCGCGSLPSMADVDMVTVSAPRDAPVCRPAASTQRDRPACEAHQAGGGYFVASYLAHEKESPGHALA